MTRLTICVLLTLFTDVTTYALHPGPVATKLLKKLWSKNLTFLRKVAEPFLKVLFKIVFSSLILQDKIAKVAFAHIDA